MNRTDRLITSWKAGEIEGHIATFGKLRQSVRNYMLVKANYRCQQCGWAIKNEFTGRIPLTVSHIDGNWKNSIEENLEVLCPNCHSLTNSYCGRNKGKGRPRKYRIVDK